MSSCGVVETGGDRIAELKERGSAKIGFANEAPYAFRDKGGKLTGEAIAVARAVLERLEIPEIEGVLVDFGALIPGLNAGNFDMIAAGMYITPERCDAIAFSDPDYSAPQILVVQKGNPLGLTDFQSVLEQPQARLAILQGGTALEWARAIGIPEERLLPLPDAQALLAAVQAGRANAFTLTSPAARHLVTTAGSSDLVAGEPFIPVVDGEEQVSYGGYGFRKDDTKFRDVFTDELNQMQEQGEILPLVKEFGFTATEIDAAKDVTVEQLCGGNGG